MSHNNLVFQSHTHNFPQPMFNEQQHHLPLFQYNTAYFNPYEVKHRKRTSRAQLTVLEATFQENNKPSSATKKALAAQLDMPIRNVQVWFQNRRAKDKNLAAKAKAKEAAAAAAADQAAREGVDDDDDDEDFDDELSCKAESTTPPAGSSSSSAASTLSPPSNLALRRGSAPNLRGNTPPDFASSTSTFKIHPSPHQAAARSASDSRTIGNPTLAQPPNNANVPAGVNLGRRKSLPAFHPSLQRQTGIPQIPSLPTVADVNRDSKSPEADARRLALGAPGAGSGASGDDMGHGGVYRSASSNRLSAAAAAPYPTPTSRAASGALMTYRSGSTPGTGVFRIPANPNPSNQSWQGTSTVNSEDASFPGGLRQQTSSTPSENNANQPYSFAPRPYGDIPRAGPLPSKDFVFGDSGGAVSGAGQFRDSPPSTANEDEDERVRGLMQSHQFGSITSEFSIESDATGTTATTATSTEFSPLALGVPPAPGAAFRARYPGFGRGPGFGHANTDSGLGASISYGMSSGSVAGLPGLSAGPVSYPAKFDAESRRASCPAYFIQDMASLAVDHFNPPDARDIDQGLSHNPLPPSLAVRRGVIRKSTSGVGLGRSPLGIQVPNSFGGHSYHEVPEESEHEPPQTATAGEYTQVFERPSFSLDSSAPSTASDATSHGTASSPETYYNGSGQQTSSLDNSSFPNSLPTNSHPNMLDADLTANLAYPVYMSNLTQEPFDNSLFYNNGSQQNSQPQLVNSQMSFSTDNFQTQQSIFDPNYPFNGYDANANQPLQQQPVNGFETQQQQRQQQQQQQQAASSYTNSNSSFTSFLHAPVPVPSPSSSSLAGALKSDNSALNQQQW